MEEESDAGLVSLDTLLKQNHGKICVLIDGSLSTMKNNCTTTITTKQVPRKVLFAPSLIQHHK